MFLQVNRVKRNLSGVTQKLYRVPLITADRQRKSASRQPDKVQDCRSDPAAGTGQSGG